MATSLPIDYPLISVSLFLFAPPPPLPPDVDAFHLIVLLWMTVGGAGVAPETRHFTRLIRFDLSID